MSRENLTSVLAMLVSTVWAVIAVASLFIGEYTALTAVTPVMLIVAGFLFGYRTPANKKEENGKEERWSHMD